MPEIKLLSFVYGDKIIILLHCTKKGLQVVAGDVMTSWKTGIETQLTYWIISLLDKGRKLCRLVVYPAVIRVILINWFWFS